MERELNFLSIGGIMVLFGPTETPEMLFEVWSINGNFGQNFDHFRKIQRSQKVNSNFFVKRVQLYLQSNTRLYKKGFKRKLNNN